jgi:adenosylhomocysteine nucleosidase
LTTTAILSALAAEQHGLIEQLDNARRVHRAGRDYWLGTLQGQDVVLALSRIGKVAAASTATTLIEAFDARRIVFTGVAGGLGTDVHIGDLVVASGFVQHDMDASPLFPRFEVPLYGQSTFLCDAHLSGLLAQACRQSLDRPGRDMARSRPGLHLGLIVSGDQFVATARSAAALQTALRSADMEPLAVEMEGAAVAQVCHDYGVAFAAVRTISDRSDEDSATDFQHFVTHVASHYARAIIEELMPLLVRP